MSKHKVRIVVIVRCPLCGAWIVGNDYSSHLEAAHLKGVERVWEGLVDALPGWDDGRPPVDPAVPLDAADDILKGLTSLRRLRDEAGHELTPSGAGRLLSELGRRWSEGQNASLGFQIYE